MTGHVGSGIDEHPEPGKALAGLLARPPLPQLNDLATKFPGPAYLVGGALRDTLLGRPVTDLDLAIGAGFERFVEAVAEASGRRPSPIGDRWRDTHRLRWQGYQLDLARLLGDIGEDLEQRDFTVNAMALELPADGPGPVSVIDPHGGREDLLQGRIRCLSDAVLDQDPLRLLRAVRHVAVLEGFEIEPRTARAVAARAVDLKGVAPERRQAEWQCLLAGEYWLQGVELAVETGLAGVSLFQLEDLTAVRAWQACGQEKEAASRVCSRPATGRLAVMLWDLLARQEPAAIVDHLVEQRWPLRVARFAVRAAEWTRSLPGCTMTVLADRALQDHRASFLAASLSASLARWQGRPPSPPARQLAEFSERATEKRWVTGFDLKSWGMSEGPGIGRLLAEVARGQLQRRWPDAAAARAWAHQQVAASSVLIGA
ncbi:MAG: hypothetical protein ACE5HV_04350 [Acidobacteriota bacterium]